jgi:hypothetical protein
MRRKSLLAALTGAMLVLGSAVGTAAADAAAASPAGHGIYGVTSLDQQSQTRSQATDPTASAGPDAASCASAPEGQWQLARYSSCWHAGLTYTAYDAKTHVPVGGARFTIAQSFELAPNKTSWTENDDLSMVADSAWGVVTGMLATWTGSCGSACTTTTSSPFAPSTPIAGGSTLTGTMGFQDPQAKAAVDNFSTSYTLELVSPGSLGDAPASWSSPPLRCDAQVGNSSGCVVSAYTPTFNVDRVEFPAAAAGVRWAQDNLPTHPGEQGAGQPLHRQANTATQRRNRNRVCGKGWSIDLTVLLDSCDEYPFAATREGGSMDGPDCAEIVPRDNGSVKVNKPAGSATCSRAHVTLLQNTDVGGDLGQFVQEQRVLDGEAYWVSTR